MQYICRRFPHSSYTRLTEMHVVLQWELLTIWWWRHQMETVSALLTVCVGNSPVTGEFPTQRPVTRNFDVSLICAWINGWVNNHEAGGLRRLRAHYDVTVMLQSINVAITESLRPDCILYVPRCVVVTLVITRTQYYRSIIQNIFLFAA